MSDGRWQFWVDRGGTFTDVVARRPDGTLVVRKLLSVHPERYADATVHAIRELLGVPAPLPVPAERIEVVRLGTTVATNALLERRGAPTVLVITRGHADALRIAYQNRPSIFARRIVLPEMLYARVIEADERLMADGSVERPLDEAALAAQLAEAHAQGLRSAAIVLMHGYRHPVHELAAARLATEAGFTQVSVSHRVSPTMKLVSRGDTTVVDAYLSPVLHRYLATLSSELGGARVLVMQSHGGLTDARDVLGKDALLSGPAGGIVGAIETSRAAGAPEIIGFDMGGTSTDVSHYSGTLERTNEAVVAGVRLRTPMLAIHTIAAGGGSILSFDGRRCRVGPESAGAAPGPACYGRGGPLTVTDANLMTGRLDPRHFPAILGEGGDRPLDAAIVRERFTALARTVSAALGRETSPEEVADGFLTVAVANMANAIKEISVSRGHDVTTHTLACFGGASGQHACRVADALGMRRILLHPLAGVLSAYGMGLAATRLVREAPVEATLAPALLPTLAALREALERDVRRALDAQGHGEEAVECLPTARLRIAGSDAALRVALPDGSGTAALNTLAEAYAQEHARRYGYACPPHALVVEAVEVEGVARPGAPGTIARVAPACDDAPATDGARLYADGRHWPMPVVAREALQPGASVEGPALIAEAIGTIVVEPGWCATSDAAGVIELTRPADAGARGAPASGEGAPDPVHLEVYANRFMSIAEQMGTVLEHTSHSVNIKERLDFSCALFDSAGELVANAPHMPVHLGSMGDSVQAVRRRRAGRIAPGDVYMLNDPYGGGTHLPDVTVVTPVFLGDTPQPAYWVASRAHHADIGGISPGSMPPGSRSIDEEGVLVADFLLVEQGTLREAAVRALLAAGPYPARNIDQNIADLSAQIAANETGARELARLCAHSGAATVSAYMRHVQDVAEAEVRAALATLSDGRFRYEMDNGARVEVSVTIDRVRRSAVVDFTGSSAQLGDNFNAPASVCKAAVLYVFRTLIEADLPINAGCLRPLEIVIPKGSFLNPEPPAAVVAGNVETSQVIVDALYGALGALAGAQGTMNNFTFGDELVQYYETICGGTGAGPDFDGTDAVHSHMTNSRLTDPEVLEWRFPVLLERFAIRRGSGGAGRHLGGDGVVREVRFLRPMSAGLLANRRRVPPFGLAGGHAGAPGADRIRRADGRIEALTPGAPVHLGTGDVFVIETPGGGGYGPPGVERA